MTAVIECQRTRTRWFSILFRFCRLSQFYESVNDFDMVLVSIVRPNLRRPYRSHPNYNIDFRCYLCTYGCSYARTNVYIINISFRLYTVIYCVLCVLSIINTTQYNNTYVPKYQFLTFIYIRTSYMRVCLLEGWFGNDDVVSSLS